MVVFPECLSQGLTTHSYVTTTRKESKEVRQFQPQKEKLNNTKRSTKCVTHNNSCLTSFTTNCTALALDVYRLM